MIPAGATSAAALAPCQARDLVKLEEWSHTVGITGVYTATGAIDVRLTCGIVQNGVTVRRVTDSVPGPVAALAATVSVQGQFYSVCHEIVVTYIDHTTYTDTCP